MLGGGGDDNYVFNSVGRDIIDDVIGISTVNLPHVMLSDIKFYSSNTDLVLLLPQNHTITVKGYFTDNHANLFDFVLEGDVHIKGVSVAQLLGSLGQDGGNTSLITTNSGLIYQHRDSNNQLDWQQTILNNQTLEQIDYDQANVELWTTRKDYRDSQGNLIEVDVLNDSGSTDILMITDQKQQNSHYDDQGRLDYIRQVYADGSSSWQDEDQENIQAWQRVMSHVDSLGRLDALTYQNDNNSQEVFDFDQDSSGLWSQRSTIIDSLGNVTSTTTLWDDDKQDVSFFDVSNEGLWAVETQHFDEQKKIVGRDLVLDIGLTKQDLWFARIDDNLDISAFTRTEHYQLADWFIHGSNQHQTVLSLADGSTLEVDNMEKLVNAMSTFTVPTATQTSLSQEQHQVLDNAIAIAWS